MYIRDSRFNTRLVVYNTTRELTRRHYAVDKPTSGDRRGKENTPGNSQATTLPPLESMVAYACVWARNAVDENTRRGTTQVPNTKR